MKPVKKAVRAAMVFTVAFAAIFIVQNVIASFQSGSSFPWWSAFVFAVVYFGPMLLLEGILYGILICVENWKK